MFRAPCCPAFYQDHYKILIKGSGKLYLKTREDVCQMLIDAFTSIDGFTHVGKSVDQDIAYIHFDSEEKACKFYQNQYHEFSRHEDLRDFECVYNGKSLTSSYQTKRMVKINGKAVDREKAMAEIRRILADSNFNCTLEINN